MPTTFKKLGLSITRIRESAKAILIKKNRDEWVDSPSYIFDNKDKTYICMPYGNEHQIYEIPSLLPLVEIITQHDTILIVHNTHSATALPIVDSEIHIIGNEYDNGKVVGRISIYRTGSLRNPRVQDAHHINLYGYSARD